MYENHQLTHFYPYEIFGCEYLRFNRKLHRLLFHCLTFLLLPIIALIIPPYFLYYDLFTKTFDTKLTPYLTLTYL